MCRLEHADFVRVEGTLKGLSSVDGFVDGLVGILTASAKAFRAVVDAQPDHRLLEARWLTPRLSDYAAQEKALATLRADADRGDSAAAQRDLASIGKLPNHDATVNPFLKSYGLTACA